MAALLLLAAPVWATVADQRRLERLRREAETLARENRQLGEEKARITAQLAALTAARDLAVAELEAEASRLEEVNRQAAEWQERALGAAAAQRAAMEVLASRLRRLEQLGPAARFVALGAATDPQAALAALRSITDGASLDRRAVGRAREARQRATVARHELAAARQAVGEAEERARLAERQAAEAVQRHTARLTQVQREAELYARAEAEVAEAAREMEAFLKGRRAAAPAGPQANRLKGTLPWPASGRVVQGFGPRRHRRFGTLVPHNGLAIAASRGADVRAVADGRVVFADWFQGYGRTVIIEHGSGLMTVHSHLSAVVVEAGQVIQQGQLLGLVGDSGSLEGVRLYFEVREEGQPVDPRRWLRDAPVG